MKENRVISNRYRMKGVQYEHMDKKIHAAPRGAVPERLLAVLR